MSILSFATGGMSTVYKYAAIGGLALALAVGGFFYGLHVGNLQSKAAIATYADKRDKQDIDLLGLNTVTVNRIVTQTITQTKVIHDNAVQTSNIAITLVPDHELFSLGWVRTYNASTTGDVPSAADAADATPSSIEANAGLATITENNATCLLYKQRAEALMDWETSQQNNIATVNKKDK